MRQLPHMNELHEKYAEKGLHIFTLYAQGHPVSQIEQLVAKHEIAYPIALEGVWFEKYPSPVLPMSWLIGADGKIAAMSPSIKDEAIEKELAKVKYAGLGKNEVAKEAEPAAKAFSEGKFAEAVKLATKVLDGEGPEAALKDAEYITLRVEARIRALNQRAEVAETLKDYATALAAWSALATTYTGCEDAAEAPERLKKLTENKDAQKELAARKDFLAVSRQLDWDGELLDLEDAKVMKEFREKCLAAWEKFVKDHAGTTMVAPAENEAKQYRAALKAANKPAETAPEKPAAK